jgi:hypothetical protein
VTAALDRLSPRAPDTWLNASPDGRFLLLATERFGCRGWACLAWASADVSRGGAIRTPDGEPVHPDGFGAIGAGGSLVVYPSAGGPHALDLWAVRRGRADRWTPPTLLTAGSRYAYNSQPALSGDGRRVVFDCGDQPYGAPGTAICEASTAGGGARVVLTPGSSRNELHHPDFAPDGSVVFEADWHAEQAWRLARPGARPERISRVTDDNSPCVLPDGRVATLWIGPRSGARHALRIARRDGSGAFVVAAAADVLDIGIGCSA